MIKALFSRTLLVVALLLTATAVNTVAPGFSSVASAADCRNEKELLPGVKPWYHGICNSSGEIEISRDKLMQDIWKIVLNLISIALTLCGYVAVGYVIWGGVRYIIASGDSSKIAAAKKTIQNALIGLLIALSAAAIVVFIVDRL